MRIAAIIDLPILHALMNSRGTDLNRSKFMGCINAHRSASPCKMAKLKLIRHCNLEVWSKQCSPYFSCFNISCKYSICTVEMRGSETLCSQIEWKFLFTSLFCKEPNRVEEQSPAPLQIIQSNWFQHLDPCNFLYLLRAWNSIHSQCREPILQAGVQGYPCNVIQNLETSTVGAFLKCLKCSFFIKTIEKLNFTLHRNHFFSPCRNQALKLSI